MSSTFTKGYKFDNGIIILDGPIKISGSKNRKYLVECLTCKEKSWKWSNSLKRLKFGCKKCYRESIKRKDHVPAVNRAFISLKSNAKNRNIKVSLDTKTFYEIASKNCFWCNEPPLPKNGPKSWQKQVLLNGIDRIDNDKPYTKENSVACCYNCNRAKSDLPLDIWYYWITNIIKNNLGLLDKAETD